MKNIEELTQEEVRELITYDPISGKTFWNKRDVKWFDASETRNEKWVCDLWNSKNAGKEITRLDGRGYIQPRLLSKRVLLHRLIWLYMTGEWPNIIDHINGKRDDNRWENLRNVNISTNAKNSKRYKNNTSGCTGVSKYKGKYKAMIQDQKISILIGYFNSFEEASSARRRKEEELFFGEHHGKEI